VTVLLDGTSGYAGSFLDEAFGGLVREEGFSADELKRVLDIRSDADVYRIFRDLAWQYISEAKPGGVH